jgi:hypothetical protein
MGVGGWGVGIINEVTLPPDHSGAGLQISHLFSWQVTEITLALFTGAHHGDHSQSPD